jgi:hypothetical protein
MPYCAARSRSEDEVHFFDLDQLVEAGEFIQDLAGEQRSFRRADRLREQQQSDRLLNVGQPFTDGLSILIGEQAHVSVSVHKTRVRT